MQTEVRLSDSAIAGFIHSHQLPSAFRRLAADHYLPLASWVVSRCSSAAPTLLGINGAQGTGKSTLAEFLKLALETTHQWRVAVVSIDDFYLTKAERRRLAHDVHPLLATRGVPGTHDTGMLLQCLDELAALGPSERCRLPRFDKAKDERSDPSTWPEIAGPVDLIILEGWCVGSVAEDDATLAKPVNRLEREQDVDASWRRFANERLQSDYAAVFTRIDALVFLQAPSFEAIFRWRLEQERKLAAATSAKAPGVMSARQVAEFIQLYERITRNNLELLPASADVVLELDENHGCLASRYD